MNWIWQTTSPDKEGYAPQFIITSHSPSVLREFSDHLDYVYNFRFDKRTVQSDVRNLNDALDVLVGVGTVEGEIIEDEKTGKRLVKIPKYQLAELWYSGAIGYNLMGQRNIAVIGDGATDRAIFLKIAEVILSSDSLTTVELNRQSNLHDCVERYWTVAKKKKEKEYYLPSEHATQLQNDVTNILMGAFDDA